MFSNSCYESLVMPSLNEIDRGATAQFGKYNMRNNSYFGGTGVSCQFQTSSSGIKTYNEPSKIVKR